MVGLLSPVDIKECTSVELSKSIQYYVRQKGRATKIRLDDQDATLFLSTNLRPVSHIVHRNRLYID